MIISNPDRATAYDENNKRLGTITSEDYVLHQQIMPQPARFFIDNRGNRVDIPAKMGIDVKTCEFVEAVNWLADTRIKKSETGRMYVLRNLAVRFPTEFAQFKTQIDQRYRLEMEMIESKATNDSSFFGEVSLQNLVRADGSLTKSNVRISKLRNDRFELKRS